MASNNNYESTITCVSGKVLGRIIGTQGCGTKRITDMARHKFPDCAPYLRGDRNTNIIRLTARGNNKFEAVSFMKDLVNQEHDWANGTTQICPHPHMYIPVTNTLHVPHVIGTKGSGLREIQNKSAKGVFIVHKPDRSSYLVEGMNQQDVMEAATLLNERIEKIKCEQDTDYHVQSEHTSHNQKNVETTFENLTTHNRDNYHLLDPYMVTQPINTTEISYVYKTPPSSPRNTTYLEPPPLIRQKQFSPKVTDCRSSIEWPSTEISSSSWIYDSDLD